MKTLQDLYNEILASDELKAEFAQSMETKASAVAFLEKHGCSATADELKAFLEEQFAAQAGEMSEEDLEAVAGGFVSGSRLGWLGELVLSFAAIGGCIIYSVVERTITESKNQCEWQ